MYKKEYKAIRRNYLKYVAVFLAIQALALLMAFNEILQIIAVGKPVEEIIITDSVPLMIAFVMAVVSATFVIIFGYKDMMGVVLTGGRSIRRRQYNVILMAISIASLLLFVPFVIG